MRRGAVWIYDRKAGMLTEDHDGFRFAYEPDYLLRPDAVAVSLTLPLRSDPYQSEQLFPYFDGLIPEGWLLELVGRTWKINPRDRMGLLLECCGDCIGAVSIIPSERKETDS